MPNFADATPLREQNAPIEDGSFVKLAMNIRPGGETLPNEDAADAGLFTKASTGTIQLDCEFKVVVGQYRGRSIFQRLTIVGGKVDEKGMSIGFNIAKSTIRSILDSNMGLNPTDRSPAADAKRNIPSYHCLNGIEFAARTGIEAGTDQYPDKTTIAAILTVANKEYEMVMRGDGDQCPLQPGGVRRRSVAAPATAQVENAWGGRPAATPAAAVSAPTPAVAAPNPLANLGWLANR